MATASLNDLIEAATAKAETVVTITRCDGSSFQGRNGYGSADNGVVQVYVVPVSQRTRSMQEHYRATFYVKQGDAWKRVTRVVAEAANATKG